MNWNPFAWMRKPPVETKEQIVTRAANALWLELHERQLKLIADKHTINACKEQMKYLSEQVQQ